MIIDTSALVAVTKREAEHERIRYALVSETGFLPAPVLTEFRMVISGDGNAPDPDAEAILADLLAGATRAEPYAPEDAAFSFAAIEPFGRANGRGGKLNLLDLMVYGMAKRTGRPILCTGRDFAATDIPIHPASRPW